MSDRFLTHIDKAGLYYLPSGQREAIEKMASTLHFQTLLVDMVQYRTIAQVLQHLGSALHFPVWYGANLDALYDCLTDSDWQARRGHVLLINGLDELRLAEPENFATLIEVFQAAAEACRDAGVPLWVLLDTSARNIIALPTE